MQTTTTAIILPESFDPANPQDVGAARSPGHSIRDRSPKQLTFGPAEAVKQKPTIARLRDACDAFHLKGTVRLLAFELLSYWQPGGAVFPSIATLADGLGLKRRMVQYHLARLERVGLWVRHGQTGTTNTYALQLPGLAVAGGGVQWVARGGCNGLHPEVTNEVSNTV